MRRNLDRQVRGSEQASVPIMGRSPRMHWRVDATFPAAAPSDGGATARSPAPAFARLRPPFSARTRERGN